MNTSRSAKQKKKKEKPRLPCSPHPCFENWNILNSWGHCLSDAQVSSCNTVFPRDNSPNPVGFSLHSHTFNLNTICFWSFNWLCSLSPCYFLFVLHTWGPFLFLLNLLNPVKYASIRYCYLICRCNDLSSFDSTGNCHKNAWMEGRGTDSTNAR